MLTLRELYDLNQLYQLDNEIELSAKMSHIMHHDIINDIFRYI